MCPNEQLGRMTPISTRANVALAGTFGYELDFARLSVPELEQIPEQVRLYHKYRPLVEEGDYYRLHSWTESESYDSWMLVSKDGNEALVTYVQVLASANVLGIFLPLDGLVSDARYTIEETGETFFGDELMNCGLKISPMKDFESRLFHLLRAAEN